MQWKLTALKKFFTSGDAQGLGLSRQSSWAGHWRLPSGAGGHEAAGPSPHPQALSHGRQGTQRGRWALGRTLTTRVRDRCRKSNCPQTERGAGRAGGLLWQGGKDPAGLKWCLGLQGMGQAWGTPAWARRARYCTEGTKAEKIFTHISPMVLIENS